LQYYVFIMHGILEGLLSSVLVGVVLLVYPPTFNFLLRNTSDDAQNYFIRIVAGLLVAIGAMCFHFVWKASLSVSTPGDYYALKNFAFLLCIGDALFTMVHILSIGTFGYLLLIPTVLDLTLLISKIILFGCGFADKHMLEK